MGGTRTIHVDVRLVAATNRDLEKMVAERLFRSDLYYRLKVFPIMIPPLRELARGYSPCSSAISLTRATGRTLGKSIQEIPDETMQAFVRWNWPGNIRELENFLERAVILSRGPALQAPLRELQLSQAEIAETASAPATLESNERVHILKVLRETKGMIAGHDGAAAKLGLNRTTLNSKLKKLGITSRRDYI